MPHREQPPTTEKNEVWLEGRPYRVQGNLAYELANMFGRKINQGDPRPDDHPTNSTSIQADWTGGGQVLNMDESSDFNRFNFSTCETAYANAIFLPPQTRTFAAPDGESGSPIVLGDYNDRLLVAWEQNVYAYDAVGDTLDFLVDLGITPTAGGKVYREQGASSGHEKIMFIPTGTGYVTLRGVNTVEAGTAVKRIVAFEIWDNKIFRLDIDGDLHWALERATVEATDWTFSGGVPDDSIPRELIRYMDKGQSPVLFVTTDGSTWKHDFANNLLHEDDLWFPRGPNQGLAAAKHRTEVWVGSGVGAYMYDNNTISAAGMDSRDGGLPRQFRGAIVSMTSTLNDLYALIRGATVAVPTLPETFDLMVGDGDPMTLSVGANSNLLMKYNGFGWHYAWSGDGAAPTNVRSSNAQGTYSLWWGANGTLYTQKLSTTYFNADDPLSAERPYALSCFHTGSWNDWNWESQPKIGKEVNVKVTGMPAVPVPGFNVHVYYQLDEETAIMELAGVIETSGKYRYFLGVDHHDPLLPDGKPRYRGAIHDRYRLLFQLNRPDDPAYEWTSPFIRWHTVVARRWLRPQPNFRMTLDLTNTLDDYSPEDQWQFLRSLAIQQQAVHFQYGQTHLMVDLVLFDGPVGTGKDDRSMVRTTLFLANDMGDEDGEYPFNVE